MKRVPKRFAAVALNTRGAPVTQVRQCLHTDSHSEALAKAAAVEANKVAEWEAALAGDEKNAAKHFAAAKKLAETHGFVYTPAPDIAEQNLADVVKRLNAVNGPAGITSPTVVEAVLGGVPEVFPTIREVMQRYFDLTKTRHLKKSPAQLKRWRQKRIRAVENLLSVLSTPDHAGGYRDIVVSEISREDAIKFRDWWSARVEGGLKLNTANRDISSLSELLRTWARLTNTEFDDPFAGLNLEGKDQSARPAFSLAWIKQQILADGALDGLNDEARDVFLVMINTGLRPSEITDAPIDDFVLSDKIPHIRVAPNGRELKVSHTMRDIPLLGVSLLAAQRIAGRGGIARYTHKASGWSAAVNKYLKTNGLRESPDHVVYSIRHYVENALLAAKVDDRVRADILGHKYQRPRYGDGGGLKGRRDALKLIAL